MTNGELLQELYDRGMKNPRILEDTATVYCAGNEEYFAVDSIHMTDNENDIVEDSLIITIQN